MSLWKMNISKVALPEGTVLSQEEVAKHLGWNKAFALDAHAGFDSETCFHIFPYR